jgi:hypothetical protein
VSTAVVKAASVTLQPSAHCKDCDWEWAAGPRTRALAKSHAQARDHGVVVVVVKRDLYRVGGGPSWTP